MLTTIENNKRIAKNTCLLYFRMLFVMGISLYTSRIVLKTLGIEDFGINNIVAGLASMFVFFASSLSNATQRFLNFELGKDNLKGANDIFNLSIFIYLGISILVFILAETIGLWFVMNKLIIPPNRISAALWLYHITIISSIFTLNGIVYNSVLIAHENMKVYAYISIFEGISKLLIAYALIIISCDKLILYGFLYMLVTLGVQLCYLGICIRKYKECKFHFYFDATLFKKLFSFIGWNFGGTAVWAINQQGLNILLNLFFGIAVNAARGIAFQVNVAVSNFANNFFTAVRPQIVKSYARGDLDYFFKLIYSSSRYSFYLLLIICLPLLFRTEYIIRLWLGNIPEYTVPFTQWVLVFTLIDVLTNPIWAAVQAIGRLKNYCMIGNIVFLSAFPLGYLFLKLGLSPVSIFVAMVIARLLYIVISLYLFKRLITFSILSYAKKVLLPIALISTINTLFLYPINTMLSNTFIGFTLFSLLSILTSIITVYWIGFTQKERLYIVEFIQIKMKKWN